MHYEDTSDWLRPENQATTYSWMDVVNEPPSSSVLHRAQRRKQSTTTETMSHLVPVTAILAVFGSAVAVAWIIARTIQHRVQSRSDQLQRVLDRFGSAEAFVAFAQTEAGERLLERITALETDVRTDFLPHLRKGLISAFLGIGGVALTIVYDESFIIPGVAFLALGLGYLSASAVTWYFRRDILEVEFPH